MQRCIFLTILLLTMTVACRRHTVSVPKTPADDAARVYIDLAAGWRLRVVTPLLRSGAYGLHADPEKPHGNEIVVQTGDQFLGYETAYYQVVPNGKGVQIVFQSAEVMANGKQVPEEKPRVALFSIPRRYKYIRLVYLKRASESDHDMALVAAKRVSELAKMTKQVLANPSSGCSSDSNALCNWIPGGIAVRPEKPASEGHADWIPPR